MTRPKLISAIFCVMVLVGLASPIGSAHAALTWLVLNSAGTVASELKAELAGKKDSDHLTLLTELVGLKVAVTCSGVSFKNLNLETSGKLTEGGKAIFTECEAYKETALGENLGCVVKSTGAASGTVETNELKGDLALHEDEVLAKIEPKGENFTTLRLEECALTEVNPVRGTLYIKDGLEQATIHALEHLVEVGPLTALYLGAHSTMKLELTKLDGSIWMKLSGAHNGREWSSMDA